MRKFKLDKITSNRISALVLSGVMLVTPVVSSGCTKKQTDDSNNTEITMIQNSNDSIKKGIKYLFPQLNEDVINNTSLIIQLDEIAKEDENGKISSDIISNFKSKIDSDNMMNDFNSFLDTLEQTMIEEKQIKVTSDLVIEQDKDILSKIELITSNIINGTEEEKIANFNLMYKLNVEEDEINYDGMTFDVRDLSYSGRALAQAYARVSAYYARNYITEEQYNKMDDRTNNQNNKAYIKTKLEILANNMVEESEVGVVNLFNNKYNEASAIFSGKINVSNEDIKTLVNYLNLEYLDSDKVSNKDKNIILDEYDETKISSVLSVIDAIAKYNQNNPNNIILLSNLLVDNYKTTDTGKVDVVALDSIQNDIYRFLNQTTLDTTSSELFNNAHFQDIYKYFTKQDFVHKYGDGTQINVTYQNISGGTIFVINELVIYTFSSRPNIKEYSGYEEKINKNLEESIQYIQNTVTGECEKVDASEFIKIK